MADTSDHDELVDVELRQAAEYEMRRTLHDPDSNRVSKRAKLDGEAEDEYLEVGRFDYSSVKDLAAGITCFLASCDFRREKSTTREVNSLLKPYLLPAPTATATAGAPDSNNNDANNNSKTPLLSNLKISCRGLTLLKLNHGTKEEDQPLAAAKLAQQAVTKIYEYAAARTESTPQIEFIQRLIPILSTCVLEVNALQACAARVAGIAALEFQQNRNDIDGKAGEEEKLPTTFGIHLNNRESGAIHSSTGESTEGDLPGTTTKPADVAPDRMQIISAVAAGLTTELKDNFHIDATVDLKAPTVVVNVEVLPIMGKMYAGIAILPQKVCNLKSKLGIKVLRQPQQQHSRGGKGGGGGAGNKATKKKNDQQN